MGASQVENATHARNLAAASPKSKKRFWLNNSFCMLAWSTSSFPLCWDTFAMS